MSMRWMLKGATWLTAATLGLTSFGAGSLGGSSARAQEGGDYDEYGAQYDDGSNGASNDDNDDYVWVEGHYGVDGEWIEGYWRERSKDGFVWVEAYVDENGYDVPAHWEPVT